MKAKYNKEEMNGDKTVWDKLWETNSGTRKPVLQRGREQTGSVGKMCCETA